MASLINASTSPAGIIQTADGTANLSLQSNGTTIAALTSTGMAVTGTLSASGVTTFAAGTAALPAITTTGDTDTGIWFPAANTVAASTSGTEAMRIDSSGQVGIGTTSPSGKLDVKTGTGANFRAVFATTNQVEISNYSSASGYQEMLLDGSPLTFYTGTAGGGSSSERMRIDSSGNVLVGCTATPSASVKGSGFIPDSTGTGTDLYIAINAVTSDRVVWFYNPNGLVGGIVLSGSATAYNTSSDYRLKENIAPMTGALDKVAKLKPVNYKWKIDGTDGQGFIAHELAEIVPQAVTGEKDAVNEDGSIDPQGIDTSFLVATLTAAIQEQQALITSLTARITALEGA